MLVAAAVITLTTPVAGPGVWIVNEKPFATVTVPVADPRATTRGDAIAGAGASAPSTHATAQQPRRMRFTSAVSAQPGAGPSDGAFTQPMVGPRRLESPHREGFAAARGGGR